MIRYKCSQHRLVGAIGKPCPCHLAVDLRKWPRAVVTGQTISKEQAAEIIVRTELWSLVPLFKSDLATNNRQWLASVRQMLAKHQISLKEVSKYDFDHYVAAEKERQRMLSLLQHIPLGYIYNNKIGSTSCRTAGWCNWNGQIYFNSALGKWCTLDELAEEWHVIAQTFPYLKLTCQLFNENPDDGDHLLAMLQVVNGDVEVWVGSDVGQIVNAPTDFAQAEDLDWASWINGQYCDVADLEVGIKAAIAGKPCPLPDYVITYQQDDQSS